MGGSECSIDEMINEDVIKTLCEIENGCCLQRSLDSILIDIFHVLHRQGLTTSLTFLFPLPLVEDPVKAFLQQGVP